MTKAVFLTALLSASALAAAQDAGGHPCAEVKDATPRLLCYDRAFPPVSGSAAPIDREAERAQALKDFGLNRHQLRKSEPERMRESAPDRVQASVTRVSYNAQGKRVITLNNEQAWLLTESTSRGDLRVGDQVTIKEAALSTYMMVTPGGIALRARRTR